MVKPFRRSSPDAPEADVAHAGVDHLRAPGGRPVAQAVGVGAQVRAALDHLAADPELRLGRVVARLEVAAPRVLRRAAGDPASSGCRLVHQSSVHSQTLPAMSKSPNPLAGKLPTGAVRRKPLSPVLRHGKSGPSQVLAMILPPGRASSPQVNARPVEAAARGVLPLGLGGQGGAGPGRVRERVLVGDVHHRVVEPLVDRALRDRRGCLQQAPGFQRHHWLRWRRSTGPRVGVKTIEPGCRFSGGRVRVVGRVEVTLGHGDVAGGVHERRELGVGHRGGVDREGGDPHLVGRRLLRIVVVGAHRERAARAGATVHVSCSGRRP